MSVAPPTDDRLRWRERHARIVQARRTRTALLYLADDFRYNARTDTRPNGKGAR